MRVRQLPVMLATLSLLFLAGCGKPGGQTSPPQITEEARTAQFLVGKWEAGKKGDKPIDWTFFDADLTSGPPLVWFTPRGGCIAYLAAGDEYGPTGVYQLVDGKLELTGPSVDDGPKPKSHTFTLEVNDKSLVLIDEGGHTQRFTRAQPVAGSVKIAHLPLCCEGCGIVLEEELAKLPGVSRIKINPVLHSATLTLKDADDINKVRTALHQAGMDGQLSLNGRVLQQPGITYGGPLANKIVLTDVHACCTECEENLAKLLKSGAVKVSFKGDGSRTTVTITGNNLNLNTVMSRLGNAGYFFTVESP